MNRSYVKGRCTTSIQVGGEADEWEAGKVVEKQRLHTHDEKHFLTMSL